MIETDCEVDFAPPLDYVEPVRQPPGASLSVSGQEMAFIRNLHPNGHTSHAPLRLPCMLLTCKVHIFLIFMTSVQEFVNSGTVQNS